MGLLPKKLMQEATQSMSVVLKELLDTLKEIELTTKKININLEIMRDLQREKCHSKPKLNE